MWVGQVIIFINLGKGEDDQFLPESQPSNFSFPSPNRSSPLALSSLLSIQYSPCNEGVEFVQIGANFGPWRNHTAPYRFRPWFHDDGRVRGSKTAGFTPTPAGDQQGTSPLWPGALP